MSRENVDIVREVYEASARRDSEAVLSLYDPEVEWDTTRHPMAKMFDTAVHHGHEGLRSWFGDWYDAFEDFDHTCEELIEAGDQVVSVGTDTGRGRSSGLEVERTICGLWTIRDGKVARVVWFPTREEALEAAGVSDAPGALLSTIELARRVMAALSRRHRDASELNALADPAVEWHTFFAQLEEGGVYHGHEGTERWMRDLDEAFESIAAEVDDGLAVGDTAVLVGRVRYRGKGSGLESHAEVGWLLRFREGKVFYYRAFRDPEQAFQAVGRG